MRIYFYYIIVSMLSFSSLKAQENVQWPKFKLYQPFQAHVYSQIKGDTGLRNWGCTTLITSVKFTINEEGIVSSVEVVPEETPLKIVDKLKDIVRGTHGNWEPMEINGKAVESHPMILPIYFYLESECKENSSYKPKYTFLESFNKMFSFKTQSDDKHYSIKNVMIFPPITIYTSAGFMDLNPIKKKPE